MILIGRLCEKFIEAGWLVALVLVVAFLNPFSDQVFEPDKAVLLRALVALMVAAWIIRALDISARVSAEEPEKTAAGHLVARAIHTVREMPIAGLALLLPLSYLASTITSIAPRVSWWGSYQRAQGTYTFLTYLGLFFVVLSVLRYTDQLHRLITILLITSVPVAAYAVLQRYGMSLLQFSGVGDVEVRVISTLGNAIFLAAYLVMVIPLTLWRLLEAVRTRLTTPARSVLAVALYGGMFALQLMAVVFTQSRGPALGMLAEFFIFVLLVALLRRRRGWALASMLLAGVAVVLLLALNISGVSTGSLQSLPLVGRFSHLAESNEVRARALAWDTALNAIRTAPVRVVLGYGPETMKSTLTRFMPAELWSLQGGGQYGTFDRAHNAMFDALYARGVVGGIGYLLLYGLIFYQALRWMGFVQTRREASSLIGLLVGGAALGWIIPWSWRSDWVFVGVGMPAGMLAGMVLYLLSRAVSPAERWTDAALAVESTGNEKYSLLLAALLAAIVGHFVETQTGIGIVATRSYFWVYTALAILLGTGRISEPELARRPGGRPAGRNPSRRNRRGRRRDQAAAFSLAAQGLLRPLVAMALVVAVLLGTLSYAFVHGFNVPGARGPAQILILTTWLFAGLIVLLERERFDADLPPLVEDALVYAIASLAWLVPFALYHRVSARTLEHLTTNYLVFVVWLLLAVVGIAAALLQLDTGALRSAMSSNRVVVYPVLIFLALFVVWGADLARIQADIHEKVGRTAMSAGRWDQAIPHLQRAVVLQPRQDQYYIYLGGAYVEQARLASNPATKETWMLQARQIFERGQALAPRDSDHPRQLGLMYRVWAGWAPDATTRRQRLQTSLEYYRAAVELNPENPDLRLDLAGAYFALGMDEEARAQYQHAVDIGSLPHLGRAYAGLGDIYLIRGQLNEAVKAYRKAMRIGRDRQEVLQMRVRAANDNPNDVQVRASLALTYAAANRKKDALEELNAALEIASSEAERSEVEELIAMIK